MRFSPGFLKAGIRTLVEELDTLTGWASVVQSTNDLGSSGSVGISTSNPFSGSGSAILTTADTVGGEGDIGCTALAKTFVNPGYTRLRVAFATTGVSSAPTMSGGALSLISDTATGVLSPSGTSPGVWHEQLYSISGAGGSITLTLNPGGAVGIVYFDRVELF